MWWITLLAIVVAVAAAFWFAPKGWRTIVVNAFVALGAAVPSIVDYLVNGGVNVAELVPAGMAVWIVPALSILNMVLRRITTTPMGKS